MIGELAVARVAILRLFRDRSNIFFIFIFPLALVLLLGLSFGGSVSLRIGVAGGVGDPSVAAVIADLEARDVTVIRHADAADLVAAVERNEVAAGIVLPDDLRNRLLAGDTAPTSFVARPDGNGPALQAFVVNAVAREERVTSAARFAAEQTGTSAAEQLALATQVTENSPGIAVLVKEVGAPDPLFEEFGGLGQYDLGASSQLVLFMFLTSLAGSAALIQSRQLGVSRRMLSTPTSVGQIVRGEVLGRWGVALVQGAYILFATLFAFGVDWGDPVGAIAVVLMFGLVSAASAILAGSVFTNDSQASGAGVGIGLGLAALGGCMVPIEVFPESMQTFAKVTPHAWANSAFAELVRRDGTIVDILPQLSVLAGFALVIGALATVRLRRAITA